MAKQQTKKKPRSHQKDNKTVNTKKASKMTFKASSSSWIILGATLAAAVAISYKFTANGERDSSSLPTSSRKSSFAAIPDFQALVEWIEKQGGFIHENITARDGPYGRGLFSDGWSTSDRERILYEIPLSCSFNEHEVAKRSLRLAPLLVDETFQSIKNDQVRLAILILAERNNLDSFWKPFFDSLPKSYAEHPTFWTLDHLEELQSPWLANRVKSDIKNREQESQVFHELVRLYPRLFGPFNRSLDFDWARHSVSTRSFGLSRPSAGGGTASREVESFTALVPFADLTNHNFGQVTLDHVYTFDKYVGRTALDSLPQGVELQWKYKTDTSYTSTYYLCKYGFLHANREVDFIVLKYEKQSWSVSSQGHIQADAILDSTLLSELTPRVKVAIDKLPTSLEEDLQRKDRRDLALQVRIRFKTILHKLEDWLQEGAPLSDEDVSAARGAAIHALYILDLDI